MFGKAALWRESAPGRQSQEASSLQSSCLYHGGLRGASCTWWSCSSSSRPVPAQHQDLGWEEGGLASCRAPLAFGLGIPPQTGGRGWEQAGQVLDRGGENSAVALAQGQKSPPFPLLCSCCRQGCPASSCLNHRVMALSYIVLLPKCAIGAYCPNFC